MRSGKNYAILFLSLTTLTGVAVAWQQYQELIKLRAAAMTTNERADWQKRLWATEKRRTELESRVATLQSKDPSREDAAADQAAPDEPRFNRRNGAYNFMAMMERPEVQRLVAAQQKAALDSRYSTLFKDLALTPDQLDKFKDLLVEKRTAMLDVMAAAREQGINPRSNPEAFAKLSTDAQAEIDATIRSTLGDTGFAQYQNYEATIPQRNVVGQLEQRLSYSSTPLTSQQSDQMIAILAATTTSRTNSAVPAPLTAFGNGLAATFGGGGATGSRITDTTINQSLGVLAAPQVDALRQLQQDQQTQAALNAAMRSRYQGTGAATTGTTPATTAAPAPPSPPPSGG
jgi:hypothetical protein